MFKQKYVKKISLKKQKKQIDNIFLKHNSVHGKNIKICWFFFFVFFFFGTCINDVKEVESLHCRGYRIGERDFVFTYIDVAIEVESAVSFLSKLTWL